MSKNMNRRQFLQTAALTGTAVATLGLEACQVMPKLAPKPGAKRMSPNEMLNIAVIGSANRAAENMREMTTAGGYNIVALCDIDQNYLNAAGALYPGAKLYNDFRLALEQKDIDAVLVATPDHIHAPATMMAIKLGKHVYCEKPLTHTVYEARALAEAAKEYGVTSQMGTQIHAGNNYRRVVEIIQSGAIGPVTEVNAWVGRNWAGGGHLPAEPVPENIHWDLWIGPAPERDYNHGYIPREWRRWWDFGSGTLGDMGCHYIDLPFWALGLRHPTSVEAEGPPVDAESAPTKLTVRWQFPAQGDKPPVKLVWQDDGLRPAFLAENKIEKFDAGVLFHGSKGKLLANYDTYRLFPESDFKDYQPPAATIPNSIGHHKEWIEACKSGATTTCNFDYSGAITETVLLGTVAYRTGKKLEWDSKKLKAVNCPEADHYIRKQYRNGWSL